MSCELISGDIYSERFSYLWYSNLKGFRIFWGSNPKRFSYLLGFSSKMFSCFGSKRFPYRIYLFPPKLLHRLNVQGAGIRMSSSIVDRQHHGNLAGPAQISLMNEGPLLLTQQGREETR